MLQVNLTTLWHIVITEFGKRAHLWQEQLWPFPPKHEMFLLWLAGYSSVSSRQQPACDGCPANQGSSTLDSACRPRHSTAPSQNQVQDLSLALDSHRITLCSQAALDNHHDPQSAHTTILYNLLPFSKPAGSLCLNCQSARHCELC